jgi:hypothetical protein
MQFTYNPQIIAGKIIKYQKDYTHIYLESLPSLYESRLYEERKRITTIYFDDEDNHCYASDNDKTYYNEDTKRFNIYKDIPENMNSITIESSSIYGTCFDSNTDRKMIKNSEPHNLKMSMLFKELPKATFSIYRDGRCLGLVPFKLTKENDGYHNYTIHTINYKDKTLNKFFGVGSTKGNLVRRDFKVIDFIEKCLKEKIMPHFNTKKLVVDQVVPVPVVPVVVIPKPYTKGPLDISFKDKIINYISENFDPNDKDIIAFVNIKKLYLDV